MNGTDAVKQDSENLKGKIQKTGDPVIDVDDIVFVENPRQDYGDAEEMINSIIEHGVQQSIKIKPIRDDRKAELVFGHRRVKFCKKAVERLTKAGNKKRADEIRKIPYNTFTGNAEDEYIVKLIENDKNKSLNPVEEGNAYTKFMNEHKKSMDYLSKKISKDKLYIQKRLEVIKLPDFIKEALIKNRIRIGHALALARLSNEKEMKEKLKRIINDKLSVAGTADILKNYRTNLSEAKFDTKGCKDCKYNGSTQGQLFETGTALNGNCLNANCFLKKTRDFISELKKDFKNKGVRILNDEEFEKLRYAEHINSYNKPVNNLYKKKCKKGCEKFAVYFSKGYNGEIEIREICLNPRCFRGTTATDEDPKEREKRLKIKAKDRLEKNVFIHKTEFLIGKSIEMIKPSTKQTKAFTLHALIEKYGSYGNNETVGQILKEIGVADHYGTEIFDKIMKLDEAKIDELITRIITLHLSEIPLYELCSTAESFGVDMKKHFVITEEYLKPYSKAQIIELAKEIGLHNHLVNKGKADWVDGKKPELIDCFFKEGFDLKEKVPKILLEKQKATSY